MVLLFVHLVLVSSIQVKTSYYVYYVLNSVPITIPVLTSLTSPEPSFTSCNLQTVEIAAAAAADAGF